MVDDKLGIFHVLDDTSAEDCYACIERLGDKAMLAARVSRVLPMRWCGDGDGDGVM